MKHETSMDVREGGCLCGDVRYTIVGAPLVARICWCRTCQHFSGNGTANAIFSTDGMQVTGEVTVFTSRADSGNTINRSFCGRCGSQLFAGSTARPGLIVVRIGTLDAPSSVRPSANIWTDSAPQWACMDPALQNFPHQSPPPQAKG